MNANSFYGYLLCFAMAAWLALSLAFCTSPVRNLSFEQSLEDFVERAEPGSSIALFNGRDLSGWRSHGLGRWRVKDGVLSVTGGFGYLATTCESFRDFILTLDIRASDGANSGVFFRAQHPGFGLRPWPRGYEAQVDNYDPDNPTGSFYNITKAEIMSTQDGEWFSMEIRSVGEKITISINDEIVVDARDASYQRGFIALQGHHPSCTVEFRTITLTIP